MENKNQFYYDAENYIGALRNSLPEKKSIEDYEGYRANPPSIHEFRRSVALIESLFNQFIYSFKEQLSNIEIEELKKYFYGGNSGIVNIGLYEASRNYGGAEEGGWYYTCWHLIETKEMPYDDAIKYIKEVQMLNKDVYEHQGKEEAMIELYYAQHENSDTQYYS